LLIADCRVLKRGGSGCPFSLSHDSLLSQNGLYYL
jgi:hypothetical protein